MGGAPGVMAKTTAQRVREAEASHRARGEKQLRVWVPNNPESVEAVRRLARELCDTAQKEQEP